MEKRKSKNINMNEIFKCNCVVLGVAKYETNIFNDIFSSIDVYYKLRKCVSS